ncbi:nucleic acid/nucleotide deaminase domain-containing protein [Streptomyces sp. NPDC091259]|uniref:nucleic acid/nucleotide deaminase domain-containing protein n=1 Tax=Streptomyces sp. NPDC091259 TaxID=3365976 RepID=UPI003820CDF5
MFYVMDRTEQIGKPETLKKTAGCEGWIDALFYKGDCTMTMKIRYKAFLDLYLCTAPVLDPSKSTCPSSETIYLGQFPTDELSQEVTHTITIAEYQAGVDPVDILFGSWIKCGQKFASGFERGSWGGCAWAAVDVALLFSGKILKPIADAVKAADAAARTGIGVADAYKALRNLGLTEAAIEGIGARALRGLMDACTKRKTAAFRAAAVEGVNPCEGMIAYLSTDLSRMAYKARIASGVSTGRNVAVARVPGWNDPKTGDLVVGFSKGNGYHSENHILDQLTAKGFKLTQITELYSERSPCPVCGPMLEDALPSGTPISWSVPDGPGSGDLLYSMIRAFGGRSGFSRSEEQ